MCFKASGVCSTGAKLLIYLNHFASFQIKVTSRKKSHLFVLDLFCNLQQKQTHWHRNFLWSKPTPLGSKYTQTHSHSIFWCSIIDPLFSWMLWGGALTSLKLFPQDLFTHWHDTNQMATQPYGCCHHVCWWKISWGWRMRRLWDKLLTTTSTFHVCTLNFYERPFFSSYSPLRFRHEYIKTHAV